MSNTDMWRVIRELEVGDVFKRSGLTLGQIDAILNRACDQGMDIDGDALITNGVYSVSAADAVYIGVVGCNVEYDYIELLSIWNGAGDTPEWVKYGRFRDPSSYMRKVTSE